MGKVFAKDYRVAYYDCDCMSRMTLADLVKVCLYYSGIQSENLGRGDAYFHEQNLTWVVTNYEIEIERLPMFNEKIIIRTEAKSYNKFFCYRDFIVTDEEGNEIFIFHATFSLMNMETRRLARVKDEYIEPYESEKTKKIFRTHEIASFKEPLKKVYDVRFSDLDSNKHVNNAKYISWMTDSLGFDFLTTHQPKHVSLRFSKEVEYGQQVESYAEFIDEQRSVHRMLVNGEAHAECEFQWGSLNEKL